MQHCEEGTFKLSTLAHTARLSTLIGHVPPVGVGTAGGGGGDGFEQLVSPQPLATSTDRRLMVMTTAKRAADLRAMVDVWAMYVFVCLILLDVEFVSIL